MSTIPAPSSAPCPAGASHWSRRNLLRFTGALAGGVLLDALMPATAANNAEISTIAAMKPGSYVWYPERATDGLVAVVVNLTDQRAHVYRNGVRIGISTVSSGRTGYDTPIGVFTILDKDVNHHSSVYNNAPMPYSERLTWSGVALHAGGLPGYPSSHGCVHLPIAFAQKLFAVTHVGTPVIITDSHHAPQEVLHPGLVMPQALANMLATGAQEAGTQQTGGDVISMVASGADRTLTVLRGAQEVLRGRMQVRDPETPLGNIVYLFTVSDGAPRWTAYSYEGPTTRAQPKIIASETLSRIIVDPSINQRVAGLVRPGATLLVTDLPAHPGTRNAGNFVVLSHRGES